MSSGLGFSQRLGRAEPSKTTASIVVFSCAVVAASVCSIAGSALVTFASFAQIGHREDPRPTYLRDVHAHDVAWFREVDDLADAVRRVAERIADLHEQTSERSLATVRQDQCSSPRQLIGRGPLRVATRNIGVRHGPPLGKTSLTERLRPRSMTSPCERSP